MTHVFATRRRVEEFATLVDEPAASSATPSDARYADLLELVGTLRAAPPVEARPSFVLDLRERLMTAAETVLVPGPEAVAAARLTLPPRRTKRDRRIAAAVGGLALVGATTSMAMAAQSALPGDVLYPVKRAMENAQTGVSLGEGSKGESLLANATGRLDEVGELSRGGDLQDTPAIADTLNAFTDQATQASDLLLNDYAQTGDQTSIADLRDFTSESLDQLTILEALVPEEARDELMHAANVVFQIDAAARQACPTCGGAGITEVPNVFAPVSSGTTGAEASPTLAQTPGTQGKKGKKSSSDHPTVPDVDGGSLPPGSVIDPGDGSGDGTAPPSDPSGGTQDPIESLTNGLTGGGGSAPTSNPSLPLPTSDVTDGVGDVVDGVTDPLKP
ncbi:hypothetical protein H5V45_08700 [Nocardioides sp. KIGAM211]|uniref:DUF5667 domain-containing protein n=1 Tax=Nocardioides luti TaxID=2761101 RepID=A0A7X0RHY8_9ACTN|nr:DUF5667 domain-containing protein [Nocardioides luti]MBB6627398.1 hypothetical protein [Nocardioides luti]